MRVVAVAEHGAAPERLLNLPSPPCHISKPTLACSSQLESRLPTALLLVPLAHQPAKGAGLPCIGPQGWGPSVWLEPLTQGESLLMYWIFPPDTPHRVTGPNLITSLPFLPSSVWIFLTALVVLESLCQFPVSFSENYSTYINEWMLDVFMWVVSSISSCSYHLAQSLSLCGFY